MADELLIPDDNDEEVCTVALEELLAASGLVHEEVSELVPFGVFRCHGQVPQWTFHSRTLILARRAARLRDDFGLNAPGMALALTDLERIEALEGRLRALESQLPR
jgi:chaperone modulatory protein CbpM